MVQRTFFRHIRGEESQTDFFVSLLSYSLDHGPEVLNKIHDNIEFTDEAEIVATQRAGLRNTPESGVNYILDWVIRDGEKLVGYESKTGSGVPSNSQLDGELEKLAANSEGRDVFLYVFSDHAQNPLGQSDVQWLSWYDVAHRIKALNPTTDSIKILQEMFDHEGYQRFSGFDTFEQSREWFTRHETQIVQLAFELERHLEGLEIYTGGNNHMRWHTSTGNLPRLFQNQSRSLNESYHTIPFHPDGTPAYVNNHYGLCLFASAFSNEVGAYMHLHTAKNENLQEFVKENSDQLVALVNDHRMELRTSWNRLNHPEREIQRYREIDSVRDVLEEDVGTEYWKRLYFGWHIDLDQEPTAIVDEVCERFQLLSSLFIDPADGLVNVPNW